MAQQKLTSKINKQRTVKYIATVYCDDCKLQCKWPLVLLPNKNLKHR